MSEVRPVRPWLAGVVRFSVARPGRTLCLWALLAGLGALGLLRLDFDTSTESVLVRSDPAWRFYRESAARFGGDEVVVVALRSERPWDPAVLAEVVELSGHLEGLPGVRRVDSLSTFQLIRTDAAGDLLLDPAMDEGAPADEAAAQRVARRTLGDDILSGNLVSEDGRVFAINVQLDAEAADEQAALLAAIDAAVDSDRTWVSGVPVFRTRTNARTRSEILLFVPVTVLAIAAFLVLIFGSLRAAVVSLLSSGAGALVALGSMGALATPITISTMILPSILLALGSAYVMHVLAVARGIDDREALRRAVEGVANPILLSGLTTAIGFVALSLIRIDAIREVGGFGALGVVSVAFAALTLAPAALALRPLPDGPRRLDGILRGGVRRRLLWLASERRLLVVAAWGLLLVFASAGLTRLRVETDAVLWFPSGSPVRDSYEQIRERLSGISPMNVVIEAKEGGSVVSPEVLEAMDRLARHLEGMPEVGKAISLADPISQLHAAFGGGPPGTLPDERALVEQYLLLLESVDYLADVVAADRRSANVILRVDNNGSEDLVMVARAAEHWWSAHGAPGFSARSTGIMHEFARSQNEIAWGQLRGLGFALLTIGALLFAIFRWPSVAAVAVLPNIVPLAIVFGGMGLAGIPLDAVTVGIGTTALGIAVDDTIHLVSGYRDAVHAGRDDLGALDSSLERVLPPLVYTTVAITVGFGVLGLSNFTVTRNLGLVTAGVVVLCLLADLTLLPALLASRRVGAEQRRMALSP